MRDVKVFVDSDVVISSLLSDKGAAHFILNKQSSKSIISNVSKVELERVSDRLGISGGKLQDLIKNKFKVIKLSADLPKIKSDFQIYASDVNDAHIVAGAKQAKAKFLLTYNIRYFRREKIKNGLNIVVLTPAQYLQYLRSLK